MLSLRLEFLTGRYCASSPTDRNRAEWPPHPARVFSALVAGHYDGETSDQGRRALQWLEAQAPPSLHFSPLSPDELEIRDTFDNYVPVNDKALSDASVVRTAWAKVFAAKTEKQQASAQKKLASAYAKVGARTDKLPKSALSDLRHVLPETRTKQARTFPTVIPKDPVVWFSWDVEAPVEHVEALQAVSRTVSRVGHSSSLIAASWSPVAPPDAPTLVPSPRGTDNLRWVSAGQFDALEDLHQRDPFGEQRVMPYVATRYASTIDDERVYESSFGEQMLVFRRASGDRISAQHVESLAAGVRGALMAHATDPVAEIISGHHGEAGVRGEHIAIVGLPNIGQPYATGDLLGFGLAVPSAAETGDLAELYATIARWEGSGSRLVLGRLGAWHVERELITPQVNTLRSRTWTRPSRRWVSVTPVLLDRNPGPLGHGSPERCRKANEKARGVIAAACERIGLPAPVSIELSRDPLLRGAPHAKDFRPPKGRRDHRPRLHAALEFDQPVRGPILIGAGRHRGLGLFRPMREEDG